MRIANFWSSLCWPIVGALLACLETLCERIFLSFVWLFSGARACLAFCLALGQDCASTFCACVFSTLRLLGVIVLEALVEHLERTAEQLSALVSTLVTRAVAFGLLVDEAIGIALEKLAAGCVVLFLFLRARVYAVRDLCGWCVCCNANPTFATFLCLECLLKRMCPSCRWCAVGWGKPWALGLCHTCMIATLFPPCRRCGCGWGKIWAKGLCHTCALNSLRNFLRQAICPPCWQCGRGWGKVWANFLCHTCARHALIGFISSGPCTDCGRGWGKPWSQGRCHTCARKAFRHLAEPRYALLSHVRKAEKESRRRNEMK